MIRKLTIEQFTLSNAPSVTPDTSIYEIVSIFQQSALSQIPVLQNGQLQGVIYKKYLQRPFLKSNAKAADLMTKNGIKFSVFDSLKEVYTILQTGFFDDIPVVDNSNCFRGIISKMTIEKVLKAARKHAMA